MRLDDPEVVRADYACEDSLATRKAAHRRGEGPDARKMLLAAVAEVGPARVLDVGCGDGDLTERIARELGVEVVAVDQSERMVELTRARGIDALLGDVCALPFGDAEFDCAVAAWMLYHARDLDQALAELARVVRPGGRLVAVTNGVDHMAELWAVVGRAKQPPSFHAGNAAALLTRHFAHVERRDARGWTLFPDREAAQAYVDAARLWSGRAELPPFAGPLRVRRTPAIFVADKA